MPLITLAIIVTNIVQSSALIEKGVKGPYSAAKKGTSSMLDLFVPPVVAQPLNWRVTTTQVVGNLADWAKTHSNGWLDDTVFVAAWLYVQQAWLGSGKLYFFDAGNSALWLPFAHHEAPSIQVSQWLDSIDHICRANSPPTNTLSLSALTPGDSLWLMAESHASPSPPKVASFVLGLRHGHQVELFFDYPSAALDEHQAKAVLAAVLHTAQSLLDQLDVNVRDIGTLDPAQSKQLLSDWNPPVSAYDARATVHGTFAKVAQLQGDATALVSKSERLSYRELDRRSSLMATRIQAMGVVPGAVVCIALARSTDSIVTLLAILKAGASYLPVDTSYPGERLAFMLQDAAACLVITSTAQRNTFPATMPVLLIDAAQPATDNPLLAYPVPPNGASVAYIMYTSGSTGTPKGIEVCHHSILRLVLNASYVNLSHSQTVLHAAPLGFDASTLEIWGPLLNGGRCVLHDEDLPTACGLGRTIRSEGVTTAWLTAALFNSVVDDNPMHLSGLTQLLIGGEALSVPHVRKVLSALPATTLINGYGPTECTTFTTTYRIPRDLPASARSIPIGRPITDTLVYVLSPSMQPMPIGLVGELYVGGRGLARGYPKRDDLTASRFLPNPFGAPGERLYRTGDLVRYLADGNIEFIGRADGQVKVRGFRIEVGEVESALLAHPAVKACVVVAANDVAGNARLVAYLIAAQTQLPSAELRSYLAKHLPEFMVPAAYVWLSAFPITPNGKLDRRALPAPSVERPELSAPYQLPTDDIERRVCAAFAAVLGFDRIGRNDNFFDLGGNSLLVLKVISHLEREDGTRLSTNTFFRQPTPAALARALNAAAVDHAVDEKRLAHHRASATQGSDQEPIAVIAMAGRFPGAGDVEQFWDNLCAGRDTITFFKDDELDPALPSALTTDPCYVKARGVIEDVEMFDAAFFGISPREAELMDPQQRIFMELCWGCLERGGHAPDASAGPGGVFAGMYNATYFQRHVMYRPDLIEKLGEFQVMLANEKDYIATRVANRLNLTGPAISVHTACSTSLVAIAQAFASLRAGQCDMALAGGSSVTSPPRSGYLFQDGAMLSPDGRTRSFDAQAQGTVFSDGAAVVLLKRLSDALKDGNTIHAVIRGVAINNDGRDKASFTAPSIDGQAAVVVAAHEAAGINPRSLSYIEAHGTATPMGDPVELEGLTRAFRRHTNDSGFCRIGSVKSNVGHLVIAAGAAGVIKTALSLLHEQLPASIHYETPNPQIDFANSPFVVNDRLSPWPRGAQPRRAGVSSFGVGGTNAHVVLEEAPQVQPSPAAQGEQLLLLSAKTRSALDTMASQLAEHLSAHPDSNLADVAHTLQVGRSRFAHRLAVVADTPVRAAQALSTADDPQRAQRALAASVPAMVWLFPGQGSQYAGMGCGLYEADPAFRVAFDECIEALRPVLAFDLKARMFNGDDGDLAATGTTQPATFCLEYALAQSWLVRGARPAALIGHSVGEFVAAVLSGVMALGDAARLVAKRGALMQGLPGGSMLAVRLSAEKLSPILPNTLSLAAENSPTACVVAGPTPEVEALRVQLEAQGIIARLLQTSHAFHSSMMDPAVAPFEAEVRQVALSAPRIPIVSTLTGSWLSSDEATDPLYWARHLREPVRFSTAMRTALAELDAAYLELGPRGTLSTLARQHTTPGKGAPVAVACLGDAPESEARVLMQAIGQLWFLGIELPVSVASPAQGRKRIRLPSYPFERKRYWIDAGHGPLLATAPVSTTTASPAQNPLPNLAQFRS